MSNPSKSRIASITVSKHDNQSQQLQSLIDMVFAGKTLKSTDIALKQLLNILEDSLKPIVKKHTRIMLEKLDGERILIMVISNNDHTKSYYQSLFANTNFEDWILLPYGDPNQNPLLILMYGYRNYRNLDFILNRQPIYNYKHIISNVKIIPYLEQMYDIIYNNHKTSDPNMVYKNFDSTEQVAALTDKVLAKYHHALIDVDTGGGKTFMSIHSVGRLRKEANLFIVTTANKQKSRDWENSVVAYNKANGTNLRAYVTNYTIVANEHNYDTKIMPIVNEMRIANYNKIPNVMILDEGHRSKNTTKNTAKHIIAIRKFFDNMPIISLTATPIGNSLIDIITNLVLAGFYRNKTDFIQQQVRQLDQWHQPVVKNVHGQIDMNCFYHPDQLMQQINNITIKIDTEDKLPTRKTNTINFEIPDNLIKDYAQIRQDFKDGVYETPAEAIAAQRKWLADHYEEIGILPWLKDKIILNPKRVQDAVLLFYSYNPELNALKNYFKRELPNYNLYELNGQITDKVRKQNLQGPKDPAHAIYLIQYQAGSEALNAPWSHTAILVAPTNSYIQFHQALGRNRRANQKGHVLQLRCNIHRTIYERVWFDCLDHKKDFDTDMQKAFLENTNQQIKK